MTPHRPPARPARPVPFAPLSPCGHRPQGAPRGSGHGGRGPLGRHAAGALGALLALVPLAACRGADRAALAADARAVPAAAPTSIERLARETLALRLTEDPLLAARVDPTLGRALVPDRTPGWRGRRLARARSLAAALGALAPRARGEEEALVLARVERDLALEIAALEDPLDPASLAIDPFEGPAEWIAALPRLLPADTHAHCAARQAALEALAPYLDARAALLREAASRGRVGEASLVRRELDRVSEVLTVPPLESPWVRHAGGGGRWVRVPPGSDLESLAEARGLAPAALAAARAASPWANADSLARGTWLLVPERRDALPPAARGEVVRRALEAVTTELRPALERWRALLAEELLPAARPPERAGLAHLPGGPAYYRRVLARHTSLARSPEEFGARAREELERVLAELRVVGRRAVGTEDLAALGRVLRGRGLDPAGPPPARVALSGLVPPRSLPPILRYADEPAYTGGLALLGERLREGLGGYPDPLERLAMLSSAATAAAALVLDTAIHGEGWPRDRAEAFLAEHTLLDEAGRARLIDRVLAHPGREGAAEVGRAFLAAELANARSVLGERFRLAAFLRQVSRSGPLPLEAVRARIRTWLATP